MGLFRPYDPKQKSETTEATPAPKPVVVAPPTPGRPAGKGAPTPSRREAEAARRQRLNPVLTKKEIRQRDTEVRRTQRLKATDAVESSPERQLLRDHIDARWNVAEFLLPAMIVLLAVSFVSQNPVVFTATTVGTWTLLGLVVADFFLMWRGYKKRLNERHPGRSTRGLIMYAFNRAMNIRRFRVPAPRIKRGQSY